jgi:hypothetical protein
MNGENRRQLRLEPLTERYRDFQQLVWRLQ